MLRKDALDAEFEAGQRLPIHAQLDGADAVTDYAPELPFVRQGAIGVQQLESFEAAVMIGRRRLMAGTDKDFGIHVR